MTAASNDAFLNFVILHMFAVYLVLGECGPDPVVESNIQQNANQPGNREEQTEEHRRQNPELNASGAENNPAAAVKNVRKRKAVDANRTESNRKVNRPASSAKSVRAETSIAARATNRAMERSQIRNQANTGNGFKCGVAPHRWLQ
ncbi:hypothetical protein Ddc_20949 [Ditylenchus destructor]|nr:hypothetical protein Ddc_20949 [Ditylenchus destructor]